MPSIDNEVVFEGRHIELHADPSIPVCRSSVDSEDVYVEAVARLLDLPVPDVRYFLYTSDVSVCSVDKFAADCTSGTDIYASLWPHEHELVHAAAAPLGRAPAFLAEGLAQGMTSETMLDPDERLHSVPVLDSIAFFAGDAPQHYRVASDFTRYLVKRFGIEPFVTLYRSSLFFDDAITIQQQFQHVMGVPIDSVIADWQTAPGVDADHAFPTAISRCLLPPTPPTAPNLWSGTEPVDCIGDFYPRSELLQQNRHTIDVDAPGLLSLQVTSPADARLPVYFNDCGGDDPELYQLIDNGRASLSLASVLPGRHALQMFQMSTSFDVTRSAQWTIANHGPIGSTCDTATPITVPDPMVFSVEWDDTPGRWTLVQDPVNGDRYEAWVRFEGLNQEKLDVHLLDNGDHVVTGTACTGTCNALTDCVDAREYGPWNVAPNTNTVYMHLTTPAANAGSFFILLFDGG